MSLWGEEDRGANNSREEKEVWGKVMGPGWGGDAADGAWGKLGRWKPFTPASPEFREQQASHSFPSLACLFQGSRQLMPE